MQYKGRYKIFDIEQIRTYPLNERTNKVHTDDIISCTEAEKTESALPQQISRDIELIADAIITARHENKPVILFTGAHLIKNGLGALLVELIKQDMVSLVAGNCATAIHDFELALIGQTSENVPGALAKGQFGMAYEFSYFNTAVALGDKYQLGFGEVLGKTITDKSFFKQVLETTARENSPTEFLYPQVSVLAACYKKKIPFTVHTSIGTDVVDQHPTFDGGCKGMCSGRDFLIFTNEVAKLTEAGVLLNISSAVTGPEVMLKAISMAANVGKKPARILTADFDLRLYKPEDMADESTQCYYFRDQKSVVTRIPDAFGGKGFYIRGNQKQTFTLLYKKIIEKLRLQKKARQ